MQEDFINEVMMEDEFEESLEFNLDDKTERAKHEIITELRTKYGSKINSERNRTEKEMRFIESMEDRELANARRVAEEYKSRIDPNELVTVRIDRKTIIQVKRSKCVQNEDGTWSKKQN